MGFMEIFIKNEEPEEAGSDTKQNTSTTAREIVNEPSMRQTPEIKTNELPPPPPGKLNLTPSVAVDETGMIKQVYEVAKLGDLSRSIFKVQQIRASFPITITDEVIRQTIPGLLTAANLVSDELRTDAAQRIDTLNTAMKEHLTEQSSKIENLTLEINELAAAIEAKRQEIANAEQSKDAFGKAVEQEIKVIQENLAYLP